MMLVNDINNVLFKRKNEYTIRFNTYIFNILA